MSFTLYRQHDSMDCSPTCLCTIAKHYKRAILLQSLREKTGIGKEGVNLLGISEAAEAVGFRTSATKLGYTTLVKDAKLPAILHWSQNHFVVLYKVRTKTLFERDEKLWIADPAKGLLTYSPKEFKTAA